jgi:chemotaxis protein histidine kinase CheA
VDTEALRKSLLGKFIEITTDRLQAVQLGVLDLEKSAAEKAAAGIARELHTIKGEARMLGMPVIGQIAHAAEDLLRAWREKRLDAQTTTDLFLFACDTIAGLLKTPDAAKTGSDVTRDALARLCAATGAELPPLKPSSPSVFRSSPPARPVPPPSAPAVAPVLAPRPPPVPAPVPPPVPSPPGRPGESTSESPPEELPVASPSRPVESSGSQVLDRPVQVDRKVRVSVDILDTLGTLAGDLLVESSRASLRVREAQRLFERFAVIGDQLLHGEERSSEAGVDRAMLAVLEVGLQKLRDEAFRFNRANSDGLMALQGNLAQLADHVADARLVPLTTIFEVFPRAVREMALEQDKRIELSVENAQGGVDRTMVSDVRDALVHLVRNAVDHGIEAPADRARAGKREVGRITLRASAEGDMLLVQVEDDGGGIDPDVIRSVAVGRGLVSETQAKGLSDRDAMELIFQEGFSTRSEVSEVSGRGVGMEIVKDKVEALGGSVRVQSEVGKFTRMSLRLPQTLAIMRVLLFRLGSDVYGVPAAHVDSVARFSAQERVEVMGTIAVMYRGRPVTISALGPLLGLNGGPSVERPPCVVVRHGDDRAVLVVDSFVDEREVAVKSIGGAFMKGAPFTAGSAALEDGRVAILLHVPDIMGEVRKMRRSSNESKAVRSLRVLLVDDSPIARATERAAIRALGHTVDEAHDGEDGWSKLQTRAYDLIFTDVQMPRLDGFELTKRIKQSPLFAKLPVIILSSLASPEDKRQGLDAGADAFLVKADLAVDTIGTAISRLM